MIRTCIPARTVKFPKKLTSNPTLSAKNTSLFLRHEPLASNICLRYSPTCSCIIGGGTIFKVRGGTDFWKSKMARQRRPSRLRDAGGCLRRDVPPSEVGAFLKNLGSNGAIWCTIFHHLKHLTACLFRCFFFTLEQDGQKSGGAMPPSLKSGGATGPPGPPQFRRLCHVFSFTHNAVVLSHFRCVHAENQTKIFRF